MKKYHYDIVYFNNIIQIMTTNTWEIVTNNKKQSKIIEPVKFDPIPSRQKQNIIDKKIKEDELLKNKLSTNNNSNILNKNQDWETVSLSKPLKPIKNSTPKQINHQSSIKMNETGDIVKITKVSKEMSDQIINARIAKKWSQKDLAIQSNIDVKLINDIEKGNSLYNANIFNILCKKLGVKIKRNCDVL